jgi:hypothetical protein
MGAQKFVVVLGIRKTDINHSFCPTLEEAEVLVLRPLTSCPGEVIDEILGEAASIVGELPVAIISDEGGELKRGGRFFTRKHSKTIHLFDISHKINSCEKDLLEEDQVWVSFKAAASAAIQKLKLSSVAHLAAPRQRTKDRMHSSLHLIEYGHRLLAYLESEKANQLTDEEREKLVWIYDYQSAFSKYLYLKTLSEIALELVHKKGYYQGVTKEFLELTEHMHEESILYPQFRDKIKTTLQIEEAKITDSKHHLGSSEIIESLFGKFKAIENVHASSGLSSLVLAVPALVGKLDEHILTDALKEISTNDLENWVENEMGQTYLSKRRQALPKVVVKVQDVIEIVEGIVAT